MHCMVSAMPDPVIHPHGAAALATIATPARFFKLDAGSIDPATPVCSIYRADTADGDELRAFQVVAPGLWLFEADEAQPCRGTVLVIPGGGYEFISIENEGFRVAKQLNLLGYSAAVLLYRLPGETRDSRSTSSIHDVSAACDWLVQRFAPSQQHGHLPGIGILGFSAGAHLALAAVSSITQTNFGQLAWLGLMYPVFKLTGPDAHASTAARWLAGLSDSDELRQWDGENMLHAGLPKLFCRHLSDDPVVTADNTRLLKAGLARIRDTDDIAVVRGSGHGVGLNDDLLIAFKSFVEI